MTSIDKLGPVITDIEGLELNQVDREVLLHPQLGGLILFSRNYESLEQLTDLVRSIKEIRPSLLLTVDHEGGRVQRFREGFSPIPAMASLGGIYEQSPTRAREDAYDLGWLLAFELTSLGIDHSYAPVLDLDDGRSEVIGDRSFSRVPNVTTELAREFIHGMQAAGMAATAKHFPGHGSVIADSHLELPIDRRCYQEVFEHDLQPFINLSSEYAAIMTAHISFPEVDELPVSFSAKWIKDTLKDELGFQGIVISDDLSRKGAAGFGNVRDCALLSIEAGCDAVLICNARDDAEHALEVLESKGVDVFDKLKCLKSTLISAELEKDQSEMVRIKTRFGF